MYRIGSMSNSLTLGECQEEAPVQPVEKRLRQYSNKDLHKCLRQFQLAAGRPAQAIPALCPGHGQRRPAPPGQGLSVRPGRRGEDGGIGEGAGTDGEG